MITRLIKLIFSKYFSNASFCKWKVHILWIEVCMKWNMNIFINILIHRKHQLDFEKNKENHQNIYSPKNCKHRLSLLISLFIILDNLKRSFYFFDFPFPIRDGILIIKIDIIRIWENFSIGPSKHHSSNTKLFKNI